MKRLIRVVLAVAAAMLLVVPVAGAQPKAAKAPAAAPAKKGAEPGKDVKEINFEGDVVEAQFLRPDQGVAEAVVRRKKSSLIQMRQDFVDEILKSAEDL